MYYLIQSSRRGEQVLITGDLLKLERMMVRLQLRQPNLQFRIAEQPPATTEPEPAFGVLRSANLSALPG